MARRPSPSVSRVGRFPHMRNGHAAIKLVYDVPSIALYTTKSATDGEVVVSDTVTLPMFRSKLTDIVVPLLREGE